MAQNSMKLTNAFQAGLMGGLGVLTALVLGGAVATLANVLTYVFAAVFLALGLDPIVSLLERRGLKRQFAILTVVVFLLGILALLIWNVFPTLVSESGKFIELAPSLITSITTLGFVIDLDNQFGGVISSALNEAISFLSNSANWPTMLGGVVQVGISLFNGFFGGVIIVVLTLFFLASLDRFKSWIYRLIPGSKRKRFIAISEEVAKSVGRYVMGQTSVALINAVLSFILMTLVGVPFSIVLSAIVFIFALVPLVGTISGAVLVTLVALSVSPTSALIVGIYYLVYMQVEAYLISPRIMSVAVAVPGPVVVIAALSGGALLGILGALVAIPVAASIILILREILVPRQNSL